MAEKSNWNSLIYSEIPEIAQELVTLATKLGAGSVSAAVVVSENLPEAARKISVEGVSKIYGVSGDQFKDLQTETVVDALEAVYNREKPTIVLIGSTKRGKALAPRLATRLGIACISDALAIHDSNGKPSAERLVWGGNAIATVSSKGPAVITIPLRANQRASGNSNPNVVEINVQPKSPVPRVIDRKERPPGQVNIKDAEVVISAGRGFKKKEDLAMLEDLASTLNGVIGASRPLTSDLGWVPEDRQIGLSGNTVKPKLYIAVGISGQIQHLTGMRDSKVVVAINNDKNAPIFQECDYGAVGDLYAIVPDLGKFLKAAKGK
ncbi:MAG TPA: electron transfer flavoprotein subunit alpha/FixB family protein [Nitrososphaerales archaeon]|nr:electron transfer flavoprotein subunit alpha/FixB family protein [Nitrososphaerales archaeon]